MAIISFGERYAIREVDTSLQETDWTSQISYIARSDVDNENHWDVRSYALTNGPQMDNVLVRVDVRVRQITHRIFQCVFDFAHPNSERTDPEKTPSDPAEKSFTTVGGTLDVSYSLQTISKQTGDGAIADDSELNFKKALLVDNETKKPGNVAIAHGQLGYTLQKKFAAITCTEIQLLRDMTATVNNAAWDCFEAGEVLFLGVTGQQQGTGPWDLTYNFSVRKNLVGQTWPDPTPAAPGNVITYSKKGHEFLWVYLYDWTDVQAQPGAKKVIQRPALYVEKMYNEADFSLLGLGV